MKLCLGVMALMLASCGSRSLEAARYHSQPAVAAKVAEVDRDYCRKLDRRASRQQAWAMGLSAVAAGNAAGTIPDGLPVEARIGFAAASTGSAAGAAVLGYLSGRSAARWVREGCGR
jgi:hypothetical protein